MAPRPSEDEAWKVEQLLGVKKNLRKKSVEVMIKWQGKPHSKNNWEEVDSQDIPARLMEPFEDSIAALRRNKRTDTDEEVEDKEMGKDEYVVEDVLGIQWNPDNKQLEYYIKWEGWDNQFNNWEPEVNCTCDELIEPFSDLADFLKSTFGKSSGGGRKRGAPKSRSRVSDDDSDDETPAKKRPGPKSKTISTKKPGPRSRTETSAKSSEPTKRPGPKSRTLSSSTPGPASSKRPGPKSRTSAPKEESDDEKRVSTRKSDSESEGGGDDKNGNSSKYKNLSDSDEAANSDRENSPAPVKKRPGPKSRTSSTPGPASSKKKPGPRSRTVNNDTDDDSD